MKAARDSIASRILLPIVSLAGGMTVALLLMVHQITVKVREDYHRFTVTSSSARVTTILELAAADLTAARLSDNPVVVDAKQATVREAIQSFWARSGLDGIVAAADGTVLASTLNPEATREVLDGREAGYCTVRSEDSELHCVSQSFPLWGWTVTTVTRHAPLQQVRRELMYLLPLLALGASALAAAVLFVLWRNLRRPIDAMVAAVAGGGEVPATGIAEFDDIGSAVNGALARVRQRTDELSEELAQRRKAETALREKEQHISLLLNSTAEGIYGVDTAGTCTFCNPACLRLLGWTDEWELLGRNIHGLIHHTRPDGTPHREEDCRILLAYRSRQGRHADDEIFWRADGSSFPVEYWSYPIVDDGVVAGAVVAFVDITERRRNEEFIRNILQTVDEGFMVVDRDFHVLLANRALGELVGAPADQLLGSSCHEIFHQRPQPCGDERAPCLLRRVFAEGRPAEGAHTHRRADGREVRVEIRAYPVRGPGGEVDRAIMTFADVTEKTALEHQLRQSQKMEAVGRLAGGIAHDFNNMLMAIVGYASLGRDMGAEGSRQRFYCEQVLSAAEKAADLTRQILAFSRKQVMSPAAVDLNAVVRGMERIIARLLGEDIEVSLRLSAEQLVALVDRAQIEQVLMNLATNARDAMPGGGRLAIATEAVDLDREGAAARDLDRAGRYALITVSDSGMGMDERTRQQIFEPFFTTKELGKGTGLGLSIVYGIARQHRGQIAVYSEPGHGTTFRIYLPLTTGGLAAPVAAPQAQAQVRGGSETVLLAEDNDEVRALATSVLEEAGYRVLAAKDGEEAVLLFSAHADEVRLCLFDVVMPRCSGTEALKRIRLLRPAARAIFMSGYAADLVDEHGAAAFYLAKPLMPRELLLKVRAALDA